MIMEWVNKLNVTMNERINVTISNEWDEWKDLIQINGVIIIDNHGMRE